MGSPAPASDPAIRIGLGGSDAAAITERSPWKTAFALYLERTGVLPREDISDKPHVRWGNILEDAVADEWARVTDKRVRRSNKRLTNPACPWMTAHIDRRVVGERAFLECKTASQWMDKEWGPDGTDQIPGHYRDQVDHYLAVTGWDTAYVAVLIGGSDFRTYTIQRDEERIADLIEAEHRFWRRLEEMDPPPKRTERDVDMAHPLSDPNRTALADMEDIEAAYRLLAIKGEMAALKEEETAIRARLKESIGDAEALVDPAGEPIATWKTTTTRRLRTAELKAEEPDTYERFAGTTISRTLRLKIKES